MEYIRHGTLAGKIREPRVHAMGRCRVSNRQVVYFTALGLTRWLQQRVDLDSTARRPFDDYVTTAERALLRCVLNNK